MSEYSRTYEIRWSDLDANGHVNYAVYINAAGDVRYRFFWDHGFPPEKFEQIGMGPVYTAIHAEFLREVRLGETLTINYEVSGLSPQGVRWRVHHDIFKANGKKAVRLDVEGVILDMAARKPTLPVPELLELFQLIPRAKNFEVLSEIDRRR
jgi:acyl-CoA thioester hydrolase